MALLAVLLSCTIVLAALRARAGSRSQAAPVPTTARGKKS